MKKNLIRKGIVLAIISLLVGTSITITTSSIVKKPNSTDRITSNSPSINKNSERENWWDINWNYYKMITIESDYIDNDLCNFPLLVNSTNTTLISKCDDGNSVRFLSLDNITEFYYEIEEWTISGFSIWVNISEIITYDSDYQFLMYYNNSGVSDNQNPENVWDSDYSVVLHMDETSGTVYDSTSYNNNAYVQNTVDQDVVGKIDGADEFDGISGHLHIGDNETLDLGVAGTVECWFIMDTEKQYAGLVHKGDLGDFTDEAYSLQGWSPASHKFGAYLKGLPSNRSISSNTDTLNTSIWYYVSLVWDASGIKLYLNGLEDASTASTITVRDSSGGLNIGVQTENSLKYPHDGKIDEVRISDTGRNASWLKTCFHTQNQTSGFLSFGPEKTKPVENIPPTVVITNPEEGQTVNGTITITGNADDPDGIVEYVDVKIDNDNWETASGTTSWTIEWNTSNYSEGNHSIYARSYDGEDYSNIYVVNVTVINGIDNIPPTVEIITPEPKKLYLTLFGNTFKIPFPSLVNTIVIGKILVEVDAQDNVGIESVKFYVDNVYKETVTIPPYNWLWSEKSEYLILYYLKVVARDYSGNEATDIIKVWKMQFFL